MEQYIFWLVLNLFKSDKKDIIGQRSLNIVIEISNISWNSVFYDILFVPIALTSGRGILV